MSVDEGWKVKLCWGWGGGVEETGSTGEALQLEKGAFHVNGTTRSLAQGANGQRVPTGARD